MTSLQHQTILIAFCICLSVNPSSAQQQPILIQDQQDELVINLADKAPLDLAAFVDWLAEIRGMKIVDDTDLSSKQNKVQFYGKTTVDKNTMFELVQGVLRSNNLALVKADVEGWYRIVALPGVRPFAPRGEADQFPNGEYLTTIFTLEYISPQQAEQYLRKLLYTDSNQNTNSITDIPGRNILIVTETAQLMKTVELLVQEIDVPKAALRPYFYKVKNLEASELKLQLEEILSQTNAQFTPTESPDLARSNVSSGNQELKITADLRTNRLIIIGSDSQTKFVLELIDELDVELGLKLVQYQFEHVAASRIDTLAKQSFVNLDENSLKRVYQSTVNEQSNQLIVTARQEIHDRIQKLKQELDVPGNATTARSPIRFYTLKNVKAADILDTLQSIERRISAGRNSTQSREPSGPRGIDTSVGIEGPTNQTIPPGSDAFADNPLLDDFLRPRDQRFPGSEGLGLSNSFADVLRLGSELNRAENILPGQAKISIDENSNTLIVVADPSIQRLYAELIKKLDRRRPQVLIEVNVVTISANDDFRLGIEISGGDRDGTTKLYSFTNYGLSTINPLNGALNIGTGATGLNGTLVNPEVADVVLEALAAHGRSRVVSAPRILVNDNATGLLSSVAEVPFATNNSNNTVSSTSFGGFAEAGTTISVTPQISDDNYLNLEFDVTINDFTGTPEPNLPPPRNTNQVTSQVSIPDGYTIIVGGLTRKSLNQSLQGLPIIEKIPILSLLTSNESETTSDQCLFVFIKPTILRDDKFRDLRFMSELERRDACVADDFPSSKPMLIE